VQSASDQYAHVSKSQYFSIYELHEKLLSVCQP
jgi:hypothetical protein